MSDPREQTTEPLRDKIAEVLWGYFEHVRKYEGYIVDGVDGDRAAAAVVEALGLREERVDSYDFGSSVRWVSGWSVVGGEPSEGTLGVVDMDFCDCNRTLGGDQ